MKKLFLMLVVLGLVAPAAMAADTVAGSSHSEAFGCGSCHEAHNKVETSYTGTPLWGLTMPTGSAYGTTVRGSTAVGAPTGKSALCMGCHDGTSNTANSTHTGAKITSGTGLVDFTVNTTTSHPVSFSYTTVATSLGTGQLKATPSGGIDAGLDSGSLECSTCHDVHGKAGVPVYKALRGGYTSATVESLCLDCHVK